MIVLQIEMHNNNKIKMMRFQFYSITDFMHCAVSSFAKYASNRGTPIVFIIYQIIILLQLLCSLLLNNV